MTRRHLLEGKGTHLCLDAARAGQVAVGDMGDAHAMTLRHPLPDRRAVSCRVVRPWGGSNN